MRGGGTGYASTLVPRSRSDGSIDTAIAEIMPIRLPALAYVDAAAFAGLVDPGRVLAIREGRP